MLTGRLANIAGRLGTLTGRLGRLTGRLASVLTRGLELCGAEETVEGRPVDGLPVGVG